jgi:hypothetical protein
MVTLAATVKPAGLQQIAWAPNASAAAIQHMSIDHRRVNILMPQEFLDGANIVAGFEQVCGKCVPEGVAARHPGDRMRYVNAPEPFLQIPGVQSCNVLQMALQGYFDVQGQYGHPVFVSLPVPDYDLIVGKVHIFYPQAEAFHPPHARTV